MIRPGKFKHRLLEPEFLTSDKMREAIELIQENSPLSEGKILSPAEWTAYYLFVLSLYRRPEDFLGGPHNENFCRDVEGNWTLGDLKKHLRFAPKALARFSDTDNFLRTFCAHSLRSIPLAVPRSLSLWRRSPEKLRLCSFIPTPVEVMRMQAQGVRCVSVLTRTEEMTSFVEEGRDVLGFAVHDLIHADHFFCDPARAQAQIRFSGFLGRLHVSEWIQERLKKDVEFMGEWHYLISDMNTVPLHLFKTLKAILLASLKREWSVDFRRDLPVGAEERFRELLRVLAGHFGFSPPQEEAWLRLNGPRFRMPEDAHHLENFLFPG